MMLRRLIRSVIFPLAAKASLWRRTSERTESPADAISPVDAGRSP